MKGIVWRNKSNNQLCVTISKASNMGEGDIVEVEKSSIKTIAYSGVVGDLFHYGHLHSLQFCKSISDYNIVGLLTNKAVKEYRIEPVANLEERKAVISNLKCVDRVVTQKSRDPTDCLKKIHDEFPNAKIILVHGSDLKYVHGIEYVEKIGGSIVQHPYYKRLSTYKIINKIIDNKDKYKDITNLTTLIKDRTVDKEYEKGNKVVISTKADTLKVFKQILTKSKIENILIFTVSDWKNDKQKVISRIRDKFSPSRIVIRSSAINEDSLDNSMAGCFKSVLNINSSISNEIKSAIKSVINSYYEKNSESSFNQVLVQPFTRDIIMSGVVFTRTLENNAPYYIVNYDDTTNESDRVTKGVESKVIKISRFAKITDIPSKIRKVILSIMEIEEQLPRTGLDIEFALNKKGEVIIFQIRPIARSLYTETNDLEIKSKIQLLKNEFNTLSKKRTHLAGDYTILADMPDWNPAEIIGDNPNHLDYSLYDYIITNKVWNEARTSQHYYNVDPAQLVVLIGNKPYIDVRSSFNSFVPASLSQQIREKLVEFYLRKLKKFPELQDKVEFEIIYTCYDLSFDLKSEELISNGFSKAEIKDIRNALLLLTNDLIVNSKESISSDLAYLHEMENNSDNIIKKDFQQTEDITSLLKAARFLLDDCKEKATVQFSRLARLAFIGKIILKSLIQKKVIDNEFYDSFMNSISTVASDISKDFEMMMAGNINKNDFIKKYYHLRPGSYDITSLRYESNPDLLKEHHVEDQSVKTASVFNPSHKVLDRITRYLQNHKLRFNAQDLLDFTQSALETREYSKFEFTKNLSDAIELIAIAGKKMGFTRQETAYLDVNSILSHISLTREELTKKWKKMITEKTTERNLNSRISLPPIIISEKDLDIVKYYISKPNYITNKRIRAKLVRGDKKEELSQINGSIVIMENGDPGYDWIFTRNPAGLITKYGGVASHMSIRCAEFGIPAAIGCGQIYDNLKKADGVILDCRLKRIIPITECP